jgi:hypothetical protein
VISLTLIVNGSFGHKCAARSPGPRRASAMSRRHGDAVPRRGRRSLARAQGKPCALEEHEYVRVEDTEARCAVARHRRNPNQRSRAAVAADAHREDEYRLDVVTARMPSSAALRGYPPIPVPSRRPPAQHRCEIAPGLTEATIKRALDGSWVAGNLRWFVNVLERAVILDRGAEPHRSGGCRKYVICADARRAGGLVEGESLESAGEATSPSGCSQAVNLDARDAGRQAWRRLIQSSHRGAYPLAQSG